MNNYICKNCNNSIVPLPEKKLGGGKAPVFEKFCANCRRPAPRQSMRSGKPTRK